MYRTLIYLILLLVVASCELKSGSNDNVEQPKVDSVVLDTSYAGINKLIKGTPNNPELYFARARYHERNGDLKSASEDMDRALTLDSTSANYYLYKAGIILKMKQPGLSRDILMECLRFNPGNVRANVELGKLYQLVGEYEKSFDFLNNALKEDVNNAEAYYLKGINYELAKDTAKAVSSFYTSVEQDPSLYDAHIRLGLMYAARHDSLAVAHYNNAIKADSSNNIGHYNKGLFLQGHDRPEEAVVSYNDLLRFTPNDFRAYFNLGYVHLVLLEEPGKAVEYFTKAISYHQDTYFDAYYNRGYSYELLGESEKALSDYKRALSIKPDYTLAAKGVSRVKG